MAMNLPKYAVRYSVNGVEAQPFFTNGEADVELYAYPEGAEVFVIKLGGTLAATKAADEQTITWLL